MGKATMLDNDVSAEIKKLERYFSHDEKYALVLERARMCIFRGDDSTARVVLERLPTVENLLNTLVEKLKEKSVYRTLKKIAKGDATTRHEELKGWFSLGTHVAIELEEGHLEFGLLLPLLYEKLGRLMYNG